MTRVDVTRITEFVTRIAENVTSNRDWDQRLEGLAPRLGPFRDSDRRDLDQTPRLERGSVTCITGSATR